MPNLAITRLKTMQMAVQTLGLPWALYRARYTAERRLNLVERRSPACTWSDVPLVDLTPPTFVPIDQLKAALQASLDEDDVAELVNLHQQRASMRFEIFGESFDLKSWHHDPVADVTYDSSLHWSKVPESGEADLKHVWEPSRFAWTFDLIRLHLVAPHHGSAETFWRLFESWCEANPPNKGVQWACGQEASLRLMAVTIAIAAMPETLTTERRRLVGAFGYATGHRVHANISYARSQHNNHYSSEAAGLLLAATFFAAGHEATTWRTAAEHAFDEIDSSLIFRDGGSSQYSSNYHRVFVHGLCLAIVVANASGHEMKGLRNAARRASGFLAQLPEHTTGFGPRYGHDDGANVLPVQFGSHHRDFEPTVSLCRSLGLISCELTDEPNPGLASEASSWFASADAESPTPSTTNQPAVFEDAGVGIIRRAGTTVYLRATTYRFRPGHCDQLSLEIWHNGTCLIEDPGTTSYKTPGGDGASALLHSTVTIDGQEHMSRVGRFLWANWTGASIDPAGSATTRLSAIHELTNQGAVHARAVHVTELGVVHITDTVRSENPTTPTLAWCLGQGVSAQGATAIDAIESGNGYGQPVALDLARTVQSAAREHTFQTTIDPHTRRCTVHVS